MGEYRPGSGVYLITRAEIAKLHEPGNEELREQVEECLGRVHSLFARFGSAGHKWAEWDESSVSRELRDRMERLRDHDPYWRRVVEDVDRYFRLREEHAKTGTTFRTMQWADGAADAVLDRLGFLEGYPGLVRVQEKLDELARSNQV